MAPSSSTAVVAPLTVALAHAERETLGPLLRHLGEADKLEHPADPAFGGLLVCARQSRWL
jgi:hypothetical protein